MTNVNQAPLPRLSKAPLVRASLVKRRYIKYLALPFFTLTWMTAAHMDSPSGGGVTDIDMDDTAAVDAWIASNGGRYTTMHRSSGVCE